MIRPERTFMNTTLLISIHPLTIPSIVGPLYFWIKYCRFHPSLRFFSHCNIEWGHVNDEFIHVIGSNSSNAGCLILNVHVWLHTVGFADFSLAALLSFWTYIGTEQASSKPYRPLGSTQGRTTMQEWGRSLQLSANTCFNTRSIPP
jgi:hypothetical protein